MSSENNSTTDQESIWQSIKPIFDFLKDYLSTFLIIPILLGGLWQIFQLLSISLTFIRFFSLTQVIQDGLLIILFIISLCILSIVFFIIYGVLKIIGQILDSTIRPIRKLHYLIYREKIKIYLLFLFYIPFMLFLFFILIEIGSTYNSSNEIEINKIKIYGFIVYYGAIITFLFYLISYVNHWSRKGYNPINNVKFFLLGPIFILLFKVIFLFGNYYLIPDNLINIDTKKAELKSKNNGVEIEVLYMNDKFIFMKIIKQKIAKNKKDTINKIQIIKFDDLFVTIENNTDSISIQKKEVLKIKY